jgi:hypothetical protein
MNILLAEDDVRLGELVLYMLEKKVDFKWNGLKRAQMRMTIPLWLNMMC